MFYWYLFYRSTSALTSNLGVVFFFVNRQSLTNSRSHRHSSAIVQSREDPICCQLSSTSYSPSLLPELPLNIVQSSIANSIAMIADFAMPATSLHTSFTAIFGKDSLVDISECSLWWRHFLLFDNGRGHITKEQQLRCLCIFPFLSKEIPPAEIASCYLA